jgi:hypothetical protein
VVNTTISSSLTENSEIFSRPFAENYRFYYEESEVTVTVDGTYILESDSSIDTYALFYKENFYPESPLINLLMIDDDSSALNQFKLNVELLFGKRFALVLTTLRVLTIGNYTLLATGLNPVKLVQINSSVIVPTTTATYHGNETVTTERIFLFFAFYFIRYISF